MLCIFVKLNKLPPAFPFYSTPHIYVQSPAKTGAHLQTIVEPPGRQTLRHETVRSTPFWGVLLLSFVSGSVSSWRLGSSTTSAKNANSKPGSWPVNDLNFYKLLKVKI